MLKINALLLLLFFVKPSYALPELDSEVTESISSRSSVINNQKECKDFDLMYQSLIKKDFFKDAPTMAKQEFSQYKIAEIDAFYDDLYKYRLVDLVCQSPKGKLALIARLYENENIIWLCSYNAKGDFVKAMQVYYDNAEGNFQIESKFDGQTLTLFTDDINEGKGVEKYSVTETFDIVPVHK